MLFRSGIYTSGSYYDEVKGAIETSLNNFLADTAFPYTPSSNAMADGGFAGGGTTGGSAPFGEAPGDSGGAPSGSSGAPQARLLAARAVPHPLVRRLPETPS